MRSKIIKLVFLSALTLTVACSKDDDKGDKKKNESVNELTVCQGPTPAGTSIFSTAWKETVTQGDQNFQLVWSFSANQITVLLTCNSDTANIVEFRLGATVTPRTLQITRGDEQGNDRCNGTIGTTAQTAYSFQGPCLKIETTPGQPSLLVPVR